MNAFFEVLSTIKPVRIIKNKEELKDIEGNEEEKLPTIMENEIPALVSELSDKGFQ